MASSKYKKSDLFYPRKGNVLPVLQTDDYLPLSDLYIKRPQSTFKKIKLHSINKRDGASSDFADILNSVLPHAKPTPTLEEMVKNAKTHYSTSKEEAAHFLVGYGPLIGKNSRSYFGIKGFNGHKKQFVCFYPYSHKEFYIDWDKANFESYYFT